MLGLTIVAGALEFLLPGDDLRRFSKMIMGMVMVLAMLSPFLSFRDLAAPSLPTVAAPESESNSDLMERAFNLRLSRELEELLKLPPGTAKARAQFSEGQLVRVEVLLAGGSQAGVEDKIAKHLGLAKAQVVVVGEEADE